MDREIPKKKSVGQVDRSRLAEPEMSEAKWQDYDEGWRLFNEHQFWHAHEAWERVWLQTPDESRIFFQGIIQLTAAFHLIVVKQRYGGAVRNLEKAEEKLKLFPHEFLQVDVDLLRRAINDAKGELERIGPGSIDRFDRSLIPRIDPKERDLK